MAAALDTVLQRMKDKGLDFGRVKGISGAGQQHDSSFTSWANLREDMLFLPDRLVNVKRQMP